MLDNPDPFTSRAIDYLAVFELSNDGCVPAPARAASELRAFTPHKSRTCERNDLPRSTRARAYSLGTRLLQWYPVEDVLGAPLPVTELSRHLVENNASPNAVCFALPDSSGVLFFACKVIINNLFVVTLSRVPHLRLMRDALVMMKQAVVSSSASVELEPLVKNLILDMAHPACDRLTMVNWEGLGELVVGRPMAKSVPHVDDEGFSILFSRFTPEQIVIVFEAMLSEENICFVSMAQCENLAFVIEAAKSLTYPLVWQGTYQPLLPLSSLRRAFACPMPFLYGAAIPLIEVGRHSTQKMLIVDLDNRRVEWLIPPDTHMPKLSVTIPSDLNKMLVERISQRARTVEGWQDHARLAFLQVFLSTFHGYKSFVTSWSSSGVRREAGFDSESFLSHSTADHFSFSKMLMGTRAFGDLVNRTVSHGGIHPFEKLCKAWPSASLPPAARELLMRRYGYTERGARAVWARIKHLNTDDYANLFSSTRFRDFVAELGLGKDGGSDASDEANEAKDLADRMSRLNALVLRQAAQPTLVLPSPARHHGATGAGANAAGASNKAVVFPRFSSETIGLPPWMPSRDHPVLWTKHSARLTFVALCPRLSSDDIATWRSATMGSGRPRLLLAFTGGTSEVRATLAQMAESSSQSSGSTTSEAPVPSVHSSTAASLSSSSQGLKPVAGLACSMKFAQFQARRASVDVGDMLFFLMEEERAAREADIRRLRERLVVPNAAEHNNAEAAALASERRTADLEEQLRFKEIECENLARQLRDKAELTGASVRRNAPLFSPALDARTLSADGRATSPTPSVSSLASNHSSFMPVPPSPNNATSVTRRKSSLGFDRVPDVQVVGGGGWSSTPSRQTTPTSHMVVGSPLGQSPSPVHFSMSTGSPWHGSSNNDVAHTLQRAKSGVFFSDGTLAAALPTTPLRRVESEPALEQPHRYPL